MDEPAPPPEPDPHPAIVKRHRLATRIWHWVNALTVFVMIMSGLMIFNAHPRLYWGDYGANYDPAWLQVGADGEGGFLKIGETRIGTTGLLGQWTDGAGRVQRRAIPGWATIPSNYDLAGGRRWHLFFAWILGLGLLGFMVTSFVNRHAQRDLGPERRDFSPRHLWHEIRDHTRLRFPTGEAALRYNTLQRLSYFTVVFILLPILILTGLTLSPGMNAAWGWLLDLFGGRQSARSIHFIAMALMTAFILVHLVMVVLAGPINEIGSMITGRYRLPRPRPALEPIPEPAE